MQLYNALTRTKEAFELQKEGPEGNASQKNATQRTTTTIYVCGITPYDTTHLGHSFTYASFDVLIRYLEYLDQEVKYVQNVTDIDDDILRKAGEVGSDWKEIGDRWTAHFIDDMKDLNVRPPDHFPRATDVIEEMIAVVEALLEAGYAYEEEGSVYFHIDDYEDFGKLSKIPRGEMLPIANERGNHPDDPNKKDPLDFVLWQAQAPDEPAWDSPWGPGRPGWHIECSTMATKYLGDTIDIHGGGADLIFPHHECEIAQAEGATGKKPFVRFWLHTAMVRHQEEKMSKSLGNLVMVRDLLDAGWRADALRLYMHGHHYRDEWEFEESALEEAATVVDKLQRAATVEGGSGDPLTHRGAANTFTTAMDDDLDTPTVVAALEEFADQILRVAATGRDVGQAQETLREIAGVLGLTLDAETPDPRIQQGWDEHRRRFG